MRYVRVVAATAGLALLPGCLDGIDLFGATDGGRRAPATVQLASKGITIAGPRGFCVDERATRDHSDAAFVVLASCAAVSQNPNDAQPAQPALLTAALTPSPEPLDANGLDRIASFVTTDAGQAALARDGSPAEILDMAREPGLLLVHAQGQPGPDGTTGDYWRGVFPASDQLVTITVSGYADTPLSPQDGAALARDFAARIKGANH